MPAIVLVSSDKDQVMRCLAALRGRGHEAVACDLDAIVPSSAMTSMKRFRLDADAIALQDAPDRLPYSEIIALVRATHRHLSEARTQVDEKKVRPGAALATGGLVMTKTITREVVAQREDRTQVLYVFRTTGEPWILRETGTDYTSLGDKRAPTQMENFRTTIQQIRERAAAHVYDERLVSARKASGQILSVGAGSSGFTASTEAGTDLLAHIIAIVIARHAAPPLP